MPNWTENTCGSCGFKSTTPLAVKHCNTCGKDRCIACWGGRSDHTICITCVRKQPEVVAFLESKGLGK